MNEEHTLLNGYINNTLTTAEITELKMLLNSDNGFKRRFEQYLLVNESFDTIVERDIRKTLANKTNRINYFKILKFAAIGLILLSSIFLISEFNQDMSADALFDKYYSAPLAEVTRSGDEIEISAAQALYNEAHALINKNNFKEASQIFQKMSVESQMYAMESQWFVALLLIKEGKREEAEKDLRNIINNEAHIYKQKAEKLLEEI